MYFKDCWKIPLKKNAENECEETDLDEVAKNRTKHFLMTRGVVYAAIVLIWHYLRRWSS
jgi:hypothetical protein